MSCDSTGVLQPSGLAEEAFLHSAKLCSSSQYNLRWANAELRIAELLSHIQPNDHSELQRKAVADYVSGLIYKCLGCEVFKFGSVPLKTYLPDGDIDLTAFSHHQELRDTWASDVKTVLEYEEQRKDAECRVSKVQCIHAEVKIVKCVVENVVVDISFNQLGGLCTLCFLEEVDRLIQKNHLFKRSILLVKAWCYYESRILGAHHGLISTYALETLVLYIFNVFHSTLRGPLEVLFTFLDYFSKFDWERYCVSLWGPVPLTSLPDLTAEPPIKDGGRLLLSKGFLDSCNALYDVFPKGQDTLVRTFSGKFLNIVDPLRTNNNLGRSVSQANYHRIRSAFHRGAHKLAEVFEVTDDDFPKHIDEFFSNTWERHQNGYRPDAPPNFPFQQTLVSKAGFLDTLHHNNQANDIYGMLQSEKSTVLSIEKISMDSKAVNSKSPSSTDMKGIGTETAGWKPDNDADTVKSPGLLEDVQDFNVWQTSENDSKEVWKGASRRLEDQQGEGMLRPPKITSGSSKLKRSESCRSRSQFTPDSCEITQHSVASNATTTDMPAVCTALNVKGLTPAPQKPPDFLFPESRDLPYAPHTPRSLPSFSSSSASSVLYPFPFVDPLSSPDLDVGKTKTAWVPTTTVSVTLPVIPIGIPQRPVLPPPPLPSYEGVQSMARPTPLLNGMNASGTHIQHDSFKEVEQQSDFWQQSEQHQRTSYKLVQPWSRSSEVLPVSQVVNLERNHADLLSPNARPMPHSEARRSVVSNDMEKGSIRTHEAVPFHAEDLAETMKADDKMQGQRQKFSDAHILPRKKGGLYGESEGATHALPALASDIKANVGSDFPDPSATRSSKSSDSDGQNWPVCAPYFCQPFPTFEATIPSLEKVVRPVADAAHQPGVYVDSSESHSFGISVATGSLVKEGGNQGTPPLYFPIGAFPTVSYYNPFYSVLPTNHEFQDCSVNSSDPHLVPHEVKPGHFVGSELEAQPYYTSGQKPKSASAAAMSERFASLSAEGSGMEPPRDLLRSDLAIHLRNLEFGRWCQEPVAQPYLESPFLYHSAQGPILWGISPATPLQGISRPFNHVFGDVKGPIPVPISPQNFGGMPLNLPWSGAAEISDLHKQKTGTGTFLPLRDVMYRDMKSLSPQIAAQFDQGTPQGKQWDMNTWIMTQVSTMNLPSAIPASVAPPSHYGAHNIVSGVNAFGSCISEHGVTSTRLPDQLPGRILPLVARQLEFGSLGPIENMSFSDDDMGTRQFNQYSTGDTSSHSFSPLFDRDTNHTLPNIQR